MTSMQCSMLSFYFSSQITLIFLFGSSQEYLRKIEKVAIFLCRMVPTYLPTYVCDNVKPVDGKDQRLKLK